ncbi:MAG: hypothetical protein AB7H77_02465, partial [Bdellovibrionales bacterium]
MPKELRKIIFSTQDVIDAFTSYKRINFDFLPPGRILACTLRAEESQVTVSMETATQSGVKPKDFPLRVEDLLEPFIRYCIENNIILPRNSKKS